MGNDSRSNLAEMILTEGMKEALAHALGDVSVTAVDMDGDAGEEFDVVDSHYGQEGVVLVLRKKGSD